MVKKSGISGTRKIAVIPFHSPELIIILLMKIHFIEYNLAAANTCSVYFDYKLVY